MNKNIQKFEEFRKFFKKFILRNYGERCPDYCSDCVVCKIWQVYKDFESLTDNLIDLENLDSKK